MRLFIVFTICILCFGSNIQANQPEYKKVISFVYDAGETLAFLPVYKKTIRQKDFQWEIAPLTPWTSRILSKKGIMHLPAPANLKKMKHITFRHNKGNINYWKKMILNKKPHIVMVGMVSVIQKQLIHFCKNIGIKTIGYYDSFDLPRKNALIYSFAPLVDILLVPTYQIASAIHKYNNKVYAVGQPSVETWLATILQADKQKIRKLLKIKKNKKVILFAGQYGKNYAKVFTAFIKTISKLNKFVIVLSPHPKTMGKLEKHIIKTLQVKGIVFNHLSTVKACSIADLVITWTSTVGIQAAFTGKQVVYFGLKPGDYNNKLIADKIAFYTTPSTLNSTITKHLDTDSKGRKVLRQLQKSGYITDSANKMYLFLKSIQK